MLVFSVGVGVSANFSVSVSSSIRVSESRCQYQWFSIGVSTSVSINVSVISVSVSISIGVAVSTSADYRCLATTSHLGPPAGQTGGRQCPLLLPAAVSGPAAPSVRLTSVQWRPSCPALPSDCPAVPSRPVLSRPVQPQPRF